MLQIDLDSCALTPVIYILYEVHLNAPWNPSACVNQAEERSMDTSMDINDTKTW